MTYIDFLKLSHLAENDVTTDTFRTVITLMFIHMSLSKQEFAKTLDLYNIDKEVQYAQYVQY